MIRGSSRAAGPGAPFPRRTHRSGRPAGWRRLLGPLALALVGACAPPPPQAPAPTPVDLARSAAAERYHRVSRDFLDWYYAANPVVATDLGIHSYDDRLPDLSRAGIDTRIAQLHEHLAALEGIDRTHLSGDAHADHRILEYAIRAQLLELEQIRPWRNNPMYYNERLAYGLASLVSREFAPVEQRVRSLIARADAAPELLAAARANLDSVPELWAQTAVRNTRGTAQFIREDVPAALRAQGFGDADPALRTSWAAARERLLAELESFARWIESDLASRPNGDFRLGRNLFERKLRYEEHVDLSAEQLRDINERAIREFKEWVAREAARIDPNRTPEAIMDSLAGVHPSSEELLPAARRYLDEVREFIVARDIVPLPSDGLPVIRETPEYARGGFASMDTPGPFEDQSTAAYFNITNVDPEWTEEQKEQHLTYFNYPSLLGIVVHEAMPGHYVQLLYEPLIPTEVRKVFTPASLVEGWAHYAEQMMVDEGLGGGDPAVRLGQLRRALQRHARWYAGLAMHVFGESIEQAAERYAEIAYFAPFPALREVQRGTYDPTYLYYALGRMQILKLREDYRRYLEERGQPFSLREFHETFLRLGLPVSLAREVMMPGVAGSVL